MENRLKPTLTHISKRRATLITVVACCGALLLALTAPGAFVEERIARSLAFAARARLGLEPQIDRRLKIFVYDDPAVAKVGAVGPSLDQWRQMTQALALRKPRAILIDKLFDLAGGGEDVARFVASMRATGIPVFAGVFLARQAIAGRAPVVGEIMARLPAGKGGALGRLAFASTGHLERHGTTYGASPSMLGAFTGVGHVAYRGEGWFLPVAASFDGMLVPHLGLHAASASADAAAPPRLGVWLDGKGRTLVNVSTQASYARKTFTMRDLIGAAELGRAIDVVAPDDVVLLLPGMYTGHTDWVDTPHGMMPGGYVLAAIVNSVISERWLAVFDQRALFVLIAAVAGAACGLVLWGQTFWLALAGGSFLFASGGLGLFVGLDVVIPWLSPIGAFGAAACGIFAERSRVAYVQELRIAFELELAREVQNAVLPPARIDSDGISITARYLPSSETSGDWWKHVAAGNHDWILVGDAIGHGISAALVMSALNAAIVAVFQADDPAELDPGIVLATLDTILAKAMSREMSMCMFVVKIDRAAKVMTYAGAGHPQQILVPRSKEDPRISSKEGVVKLRARGNPLGTGHKGDRFATASTPVVAGDRMILFTDGLSEARVRDGREDFGVARIRKLAVALRDATATEVAGALLAEARLHSARAAFDDDVTLLVVDLHEMGGDHAIATA